jgi:hypothetical protein
MKHKTLFTLALAATLSITAKAQSKEIPPIPVSIKYTAKSSEFNDREIYGIHIYDRNGSYEITRSEGNSIDVTSLENEKTYIVRIWFNEIDSNIRIIRKI